MRIRTTAAGRVNLIGDHTDYMGGLVMPMAIDLSTTLEATLGAADIQLSSDAEPQQLQLGLPVEDPSTVHPEWGRYVAAVAQQLGSTAGFSGTLTSAIPTGAGLSSSAALEVAAALVLMAGAPDEPSSGKDSPADPTQLDTAQRMELAALCQRAEHAAVGVPSGIMDQLAICLGRVGTATLIDCATLDVDHVAVPEELSIWVLHSGEPRRLAGSAYAQRRSDAESAARLVGPLPSADPTAIEALADPLLRRRARHVRSECDRVRYFAEALRGGDPGAAGALMVASHRSLAEDYQVSTPILDDLVDALTSMAGVHGARLTGAGFGGCVVALAEPGVDLAASPCAHHGAWRVVPSDGITVDLAAN